MKLHSPLLLVGVLAVAPALAAEKISLDVGQGIHRTQGADAEFVRYSNDLRIPNLSQPGYYEISVGTWNDTAHNNALALALGMQGHWNNFHLEGGFGIAYLERKTHLSGTHQQFNLHLGAGYTVGKFDFSVTQMHFSNFKWAFDWDGPNVGYDFLTFQVGYFFK